VPAPTLIFDLFDTLVDLVLESAPPADSPAERRLSSYRALHEVIVRRVELDFETFVRELSGVDAEIRRSVLADGREFPTLRRFESLLKQLSLEDRELAETLTETHMAGIRKLARVPTHHVRVLRELHRRTRIGVCSNFSHAATARRLLEEAGLLPHIDVVVISEEVGFRKPRREIFEATLQRLEVSPEQAWHVGDNLRADVEGARGAGITAVWLTRRVRDPEAALREHDGPPPDRIIEDLAELL